MTHSFDLASQAVSEYRLLNHCEKQQKATREAFKYYWLKMQQVDTKTTSFMQQSCILPTSDEWQVSISNICLYFKSNALKF